MPPDSKVRLWYEAMQREPDLHLRTLWFIIAQSGQRPQTVSKLRWRHVRYDESGQPCEIRVNGADEELKTFADVAWRLPPDVAALLIEPRKVSGDPKEDDLILPWRDAYGHIDKGKELNPELIDDHWHRLEKKYGLPYLMPVSFRHWVTGQCQDVAKLPEQARAYMQGHLQEIRNMGDHYNCRDVETNLARQAERLPHGPLGIFRRINVEVTTDLPEDVVSALIAYRDNNLGFPDLMSRLEQWRVSVRQEIQKAEQ